MKKLLIILILLINTTPIYGAVSEDIYVRKDIFELHMQVLNANMEKILAELQARQQELSELRQEVKELRKDISALSEKVSALSERIDGNFATLSNKIDGADRRLSTRIDGLDMRISDLRNDIYLGLVILGIVFALPSVQKFLQWREQQRAKRQPAITLEEIERLIDMKLSKK